MFKHRLILKVLLLVCNMLFTAGITLQRITLQVRLAIRSEFLRSHIL